MKRGWAYQIIITAAFLLLIVSCYTSQNASSGSMDSSEPAYRELIDMISRQPGIQVKKAGATFDITIRSKGTFMTSHQPLFVVDGIVVGDRYADVAEMIQVTDVDRIRVLKGSEATEYGSRGGNGVIEIYQKKGL